MVMAKQAVVLGTGVLSWPRDERQTDRYGAIILAADWESYEQDKTTYVRFDESLAGQHGRLQAVVIEARKSPHIGDLARGIFPQTPMVGEEISLGSGTLFFEACDDDRAVGVRPDDGRRHDWMDPVLLYRAIHQTVELRFIPS
jgi:hypothetical protein